MEDERAEAVTNPTRKLAEVLRSGDRIDITHRAAAAGAIDALLDAIEAGGMVQPRPAPVMDVGPLRVLRQWHIGMIRRFDGADAIVTEGHRMALRKLNAYFAQDDQV